MTQAFICYGINPSLDERFSENRLYDTSIYKLNNLNNKNYSKLLKLKGVEIMKGDNPKAA